MYNSMFFSIFKVVHPSWLPILEHFIISPKNPVPISHSPFPHQGPLFPVLGNHSPVFYLNIFAHSEHFIEMKSYNMWSLISGLFQLA